LDPGALQRRIDEIRKQMVEPAPAATKAGH